MAAPLLRASGLPVNSVRIHLVRENQLNAFVAGGLQIFIYTGLLQRAETPNQLIGVLAHEIGHIQGGHLARTREELRGASAATILATILGAAAAVAAGDGRVGAAVAAVGQDAALRNFLRYSRTQESAADQAAVRILESTGQSARGLSEFLAILGGQEVLPEAHQDPYLRTHPFSRDRTDALQRHLQQSRYTYALDEARVIERHERMRAKLAGFLDPSGRVMARYPDADTSIPANYARAVAYHRQGQRDAADRALANLIAARPDDPYFAELKGQILLERGDNAGAAAAYRRAVDLSDQHPLIVFEYARSVVAQGPVSSIGEVVPLLERALAREPDNGSGWRLLGTAYGKRGQMGEASLALAESEWLFGNAELTAIQANRAQLELKRGSPSWLRAEDLRLAAERIMRERAGR